MAVIPGRRQRVRPEVAGPMTGSAASQESITTDGKNPAPTGVMDSGQPLARLPE
jgi:hypothetical protein